MLWLQIQNQLNKHKCRQIQDNTVPWRVHAPFYTSIHMLISVMVIKIKLDMVIDWRHTSCWRVFRGVMAACQIERLTLMSLCGLTQTKLYCTWTTSLWFQTCEYTSTYNYSKWKSFLCLICYWHCRHGNINSWCVLLLLSSHIHFTLTNL